MTRKRNDMEGLYRKIAGKYDLMAHLYYLVGFRGRAYREMAVREMNLRRGDTVVDIGCGTGLCFSYLQKRVGPEGKIIGVDLSVDMLDQARKRVQKNGWSNVELVKSDAAEFVFPEGVGGIISVFVMRSIGEYDSVIKRGAKALLPGGRFVMLDLKLPENRPDWMNRLFVQFAKPFGVSMELAERRPWEPAEECLVNTRLAGLYLGFAYIFSGEAPLLPP